MVVYSLNKYTTIETHISGTSPKVKEYFYKLTFAFSPKERYQPSH